jgi:hypothetical protein
MVLWPSLRHSVLLLLCLYLGWYDRRCHRARYGDSVYGSTLASMAITLKIGRNASVSPSRI